MASYALRCLSFFFILTLSLSPQTQARESKFFSKVSHYLTKKNTKSTTSNILSPTISPAPTPAPESVVVEHGYGLYGHETYQYPPTTTDPVKTSAFDTEFAESLPHGNGNGNGNEKQGMSDTRFLENGKYYYDVNQGAHEDDERENVFVHDGNGNGYVTKEGMSDSRFMDNGKYFYDNNNNNNNNGNGNEEGSFGMEKQGMSDTRYLENGKYYYDVNNEDGNVVNDKYNNNNYENEKEEEEFENGGEMEWENENENEHNHNDEYGTEGRGGYNGKTKKLPNTYDTMEEYEKEEENRARQKYGGYVP